MGRNKNKKKIKDKNAPEIQSSTEHTPRSSTDTSETSGLASYAAATTKPAAEGEIGKDPLKAVPSVAVVDPADHVATPAKSEAVLTLASPSIFEDDAVNVPFLPTPDTTRRNELKASSDKTLIDSPDSEFSHLKKDEISETGSPGQLVKDPSEKHISKEDPFAEAHEHENENTASGDTALKPKTIKFGMVTDTKASLHSSKITRALPFQKSKHSLDVPIARADWNKAFDSQDVEQQDASVCQGSADGKSSTTVSIDASTKDNLLQDLRDREAGLEGCQTLLQDCRDSRDAIEVERSRLQGERDQYKKELGETRETLQSVHERRQKLQDEKDKHRLREADWEKEKERLETEIEQLNRTRSPDDGGGSPPESPPNSTPDSSRSSGDGGPPALGGNDDPGNAALRDEIKNLQEELQTLRDELKNLRAYKKTQEAQNVFKSRIAACATENEKLEKYGGTLDRESRLYRTLKKLAEFHDNHGPEPTAGEYAQIRVFRACIAERRHIMALARTHPDPRGFMTPYLDKWDGNSLAGGWGSTLTARTMATRLALDKHYEDHDDRIARDNLRQEREREQAEQDHRISDVRAELRRFNRPIATI